MEDDMNPKSFIFRKAGHVLVGSASPVIRSYCTGLILRAGIPFCRVYDGADSSAIKVPVTVLID